MRIHTTVAVALVAAILLVVPVTPVALVTAQADPQAQLVSDIQVGGGSNPRELTRAAGLVFFTADDDVHGRELWVTDGTEARTRLVRDIRPGPGGSRPRKLTAVGQRLYFVATDGTRGRELWVSDGTHAGTRLVKDLAAGSADAAISGIAAGGGTAWFGRDYRSLWRTDGTAAGTRRVRQFSGVAIDGARWMNARLFFDADNALWKSDGTAAGTKRLSRLYWGLDSLTPYRGHVYYRAMLPLGPFDGIPQLWRSDGTWGGTKRVGTMRDPSFLTPYDGALFYDARRRTTSGSRLFRSTPTRHGPVEPRVRPLWYMVREAGRLWGTDASPAQFEPDELWVSDGTAAGTRRVHGGTGDWFVYAWEEQGQAGLAGRLWFAASPVEDVGGGPTTVDSEVWWSDGTPGGTSEAVDLNAAGSAYPRDFVRLGKRILFSADDGVHGREVWSLSMS
jgi:ELWxxDGT repeat protein